MLQISGSKFILFQLNFLLICFVLFCRKQENVPAAAAPTLSHSPQCLKHSMPSERTAKLSQKVLLPNLLPKE